MTVSVTPKTRTLTNGTANDATPVEASFVELYNNDSTLATEINGLESGSIAFTKVKTDTVVDSSGNGLAANNTILQNGYANLASVRGTISAVDTTNDVLTTSSAHGLAAGDAVKIRTIQGGSLPGGISATAVYYASAPTTTTLALYDNATNAVAAGSTGKVDITSAGSGTIQLIGAPTSLTDGMVWFDAKGVQVRVNGATRAVNAYPANVHGSAAPVYATSSTMTVASIAERDSMDAINIQKTSSTTVDIATTGLNGLAQSANLSGTVSVTSGSTTVTFSASQAGVLQVGDVVTTAGGQSRRLASGSGTSWVSESNFSSTETTVTVKRGGRATNTWYYLYAITDNVTPGLILSTRNVAGGDTLADLPTGYTLSRQIPFATRLNGSSNIIPFMVGDGWPVRPRIHWQVVFSNIQAPTAGTTNIVAGGTAGSFGAGIISAASFVPAISDWAFFQMANTSSGNTSGIEGLVAGTTFYTSGTGSMIAPLDTDSAQSVSYARIAGSGGVYVDVESFVVTKVP
jgi:hypothetical protein